MFASIILLYLMIVGILAYHQVSSYYSALLLISYSFLIAYGLAGIGWWLFAFTVIIFLLLSPLVRKSILSTPALNIFQRLQPTMSKTEQEALYAGTTWWESEFFLGKPNWNKLHHYPSPTLTEEEQTFLTGPVETLCKMVNDFEITHELADLPPKIWDYLKQQRFFALIIHKEYGGLEFSAYAQTRVLQKLAGISNTLAITVGVPNSLGPGKLLQRYGTDAQKKYYLPRLARGEEIPCFALTSPEAGSDAAAIPDTGIVCFGTWRGETALGIRLNWNKRYITLAPIATVIGLAFKLYDPDHLLGKEDKLGITCALIPTDTLGIEIGKRHFPLNIPFQNGPIRGKDVFIPIDYIIGGVAQAGQGWKMLMECLAIGRGITLPALVTGSIKSVVAATSAYAHIRRQFKIPIGSMEGIEEPLARIGGNAYLMDAAATLLTTGINLGERPSVLSAIVKYHCTHRGQRATIDAMDILGGKGICMGPNNFIARAFQSTPISITVEGANILTRSMIIFGQGALRCHPYLLAEWQAAQHGSIGKFDRALFAHLGSILSNVSRSVWLALTNGVGSCSPFKDATQRYYHRLNRLSAHFALLADCCILTLGAKLKRHERLSARLGDIFSQLYLSSAVLKRFDEEGRPIADLPLLHWAIQNSLAQAQQAIDDLLRNLPSYWFRTLLTCLLVPIRPIHTPPGDHLDHQVAQLMQVPSATRSRLLRGLFLTPSMTNPVGYLNNALLDIIAAEDVHRTLCTSLNISLPFTKLDEIAQHYLISGDLTKDEAAILIKGEQSRLRAINVDEFAAHALAAKQ